MEYKIVLASNSPRRRELLAGLGIDFEVKTLQGVSEDFPRDIPVNEVPVYIAIEKSEPYKAVLKPDELVLTADTVVIVDGEVLGKPRDTGNARQMLRKLSGKTHQVVTGVCFTTINRQHAFSVMTDVTFKELSDREIDYYIEKYNPLDKAGAYGIQEWIGYIGVADIKGSYFNVMGLPVQRIWDELRLFNIGL